MFLFFFHFSINDIKTRISNALQTKNSEENIEYPLHEMAAYPTCNSEKTEASWLNDNNITIQFSSTLFEQKMQNLNLDSAILRLFKINPNDTRDNQELASGVSNNGDNDGDDDVSDDTTKPKRCAEPTLDAQIRVTVSIVQQTRRNKRGVYGNYWTILEDAIFINCISFLLLLLAVLACMLNRLFCFPFLFFAFSALCCFPLQNVRSASATPL